MCVLRVSRLQRIWWRWIRRLMTFAWNVVRCSCYYEFAAQRSHAKFWVWYCGQIWVSPSAPVYSLSSRSTPDGIGSGFRCLIIFHDPYGTPNQLETRLGFSDTHVVSLTIVVGLGGILAGVEPFALDPISDRTLRRPENQRQPCSDRGESS